MLVNADVKGLEVVVAAQLSGDTVLSQELWDFYNKVTELDTHAKNQQDFNLPSRHIAKIFKFRLIYGGSAYSYANDTDFMGVSASERFWQDVIDRYYAKYWGIANWHKEQIATAQREGKLSIPSGRYYPFVPEQGWKGLKWPITRIKNYPVQGFGADLVMLARLEAAKQLREADIEAKLCSTVHDSIVLDTPEENVLYCKGVLQNSIEKVPALCKQVWGYDFSLPLTCEIQAGPNKKDMKDI